ncbi:hypothetical protein UFOVP247_209 [uncultured Caudovirales phage]|uniref:Uncharacterized protein n=1 Tax=uncultured Caudovirales phage TaxID=2100421 RepID=A0A6J7WV20_9CAUD|nr:hypothetical protein UFOVP247_209 [uncultured Caudovirales phage]
MKDDFDFGFTFTEDLQDVVTDKSKKANAAEAKAKKMYDAIIPLLNNLKQNPDKPNIYWPDREKKIDNFINKLDNILSGN